MKFVDFNGIRVKNGEILYTLSKSEDSFSNSTKYNYSTVKVDIVNGKVKFRPVHFLKFIDYYRKGGDYIRNHNFFNFNDYYLYNNLIKFYSKDKDSFIFKKALNKLNNLDINSYFISKRIQKIASKRDIIFEDKNYHISKVKIKYSLDDILEGNYDYVFETRNYKKDFFKNTKDLIDFFSTELKYCKGIVNFDLKKIQRNNFNFFSLDSYLFLKTGNIKFFDKFFSAGKGINGKQALSSAIFEFFERYYSLYSDYHISNYKFNRVVKKERINLKETELIRFYHNKNALDIPNYYIISESNKLVPIETTYWLNLNGFDFYNLKTGKQFVPVNTTGLSAGISEVSTKLQGLLEVLEHASYNTNNYNSFTLKNFEFENKRINSFFKKYNPIINYYKNSLGIPVFGVQYGDYCGYGAHLNGSIALTRAFLELIIGLDLNKINEIKDIHKKNLSSLVEKEIPIEKYVKNYSTGDDKKDLKILEYLLNKNNIPPIYINLTHKNSNVFVYKTLVPELFIEEKRL